MLNCDNGVSEFTSHKLLRTCQDFFLFSPNLLTIRAQLHLLRENIVKMQCVTCCHFLIGSFCVLGCMCVCITGGMCVCIFLFIFVRKSVLGEKIDICSSVSLSVRGSMYLYAFFIPVFLFLNLSLRQMSVCLHYWYCVCLYVYFNIYIPYRSALGNRCLCICQVVYFAFFIHL